MKKFYFIALFLVLSVGVYFGVKLDSARYEISAPMLDYEYKKNIIKESGNIRYKLENLRFLVGPKELQEFITANDKEPQIYMPTKNNIDTGIYKANLHMHSTCSDGQASVYNLMQIAQNYAEKNLKGEPFYMAITDHNTVLGAKEVIKVLQENPNKFNKVRVVVGIEVFSAYRSRISGKPVEIHVLSWAINPYDKDLNKEFYKKNLNDKWNRILPDRDFDYVIKMMRQKGIVGVAHPARYTTFLKDKRNNYITEMLEKYKNLGSEPCFVEGYYQSYGNFSEKKELGESFENYINYINSEAERLGIIRTGSTDVHGYSIFKYR